MKVGLHVLQCGRCIEARNALHVKDILRGGFMVRPRPLRQSLHPYADPPGPTMKVSAPSRRRR